MKLLFKLLLVLLLSGTSSRSDAETGPEDPVEDDSWADAKVSRTTIVNTSPNEVIIECDRSQILRDQSTLYSEFHKTVELDLSRGNPSVGIAVSQPDTLNPLFCSDPTRCYVAGVANAKWLERPEFLSGPEFVSKESHRYFRESMCYSEHRERQPAPFHFRDEHGRIVEIKRRFASASFFCVTHSLSERIEWRIAQLRVIRLTPWAPRYSLAVRHIDIDANDRSSSTSEMNVLYSFERQAIRQLEMNLDSDVVVDEHDDEIRIVGAVRRAEVLPVAVEGRIRVPSEADLHAVISYCLKRVE